MISFHKAEAADRAWAHEILKNCEYPGAEYAFSCMYLWSDYFGELGRVGDHLTQHASWRGREVYLYPAGAGDIKGAIEAIRAEVGDDRVILGLSGGVDSSVVAALTILVSMISRMQALSGAIISLRRET